jgi:hypothetical protein
MGFLARKLACSFFTPRRLDHSDEVAKLDL